jgi:two-component sensor histidine kinase
MKKVLLLETSVDAGSLKNLREFADYVELPYEVLPVGLTHLRLLVSNLAMDWSMHESRKEASVVLAEAARRAADYEMVFDIVTDLAEIDTEDKAVGKVFDLYEMLFAPTGMRYVSIEGGKTGKDYSRFVGETPPPALERWSPGSEAGLRYREGGRGFVIDTSHQGVKIGVMNVSEVAFPEHIERYVGVAEVLAAVCGLAIENARTYNELEVTNLELKGFAHTVSHDLKGPLSAVIMGVEQISAILASGLTEESVSDVVELAELVRRSAGKSATLVDEVLALAEAGNEPRAVSRVDVNETIDGILLERAMAIQQRDITFEVSANLGQVSANPTHIYQVFSNLIGNAIKHNDSVSPEIRVDRLPDMEDGGHGFLVRDNGSGIPPEDLEQIFVPFFKGAKTGETGIGLSTVARIVRVYNGSIVAYNDDGACFEFVLYDYR